MSEAKDKLARLVANMKDEQLLVFSKWQQYNYLLNVAYPITEDLIMAKKEVQQIVGESPGDPSTVRMKVSAQAGLRQRALRRNAEGAYEVGDKVGLVAFHDIVEVEVPPLQINMGEWYKLPDQDIVMSAVYLEPAES